MMYRAVFWICFVFILECVFMSVYSQDLVLSVVENQETNLEAESLVQKYGKELTLKCKKHSCSKDNRTTEWEFKSLKDEKWIKQKTKKPCSGQFHIKNVTHLNAGSYKCVVNNYTIATYYVTVIDIPSSGIPPKVLDLKVTPNVSKIEPHSNVVVQCKANSTNHTPAILWLKQCDNNCNVHDNTTFKYLDIYYQLINMTMKPYHMSKEEDIYISKINFHNITQSDNGVYICLALSNEGKDYQSVRLFVTPSYVEARSSLFVLFLIPVPFMLIPICVWLCYYEKKRTHERNKKNSQLQQELMPIGTNFAANNI